MYDSMVFRPDRSIIEPNEFNLFKGYAAEKTMKRFLKRPAPESHALEFVDRIYWHIKHVLANGDDAMSIFIRKFLAHIFQDPSKKVGVCVVLSSDQGAGKGLLEDFLALLIGKAYQVTVTDDASLTGNFNCHLSNKLLIVANELGHMGAAHTCANKLKSLITDTTELITPKGVDTIIGRSVASGSHVYKFQDGRQSSKRLSPLCACRMQQRSCQQSRVHGQTL